jgi:DNA-binding CsgD family transcriptional regulator
LSEHGGPGQQGAGYDRVVAAVADSGRLLERDVELARLGALLGEATAGAGAVAAIEGPAGIGKTALVEALQGWAADRGVRSLRARGRVLEAGMAFAVVRQLMERAVLLASAADRRRLLTGPARFGAGALGLPGGAAPDSEFAAIHGLYWLLANLAERTPLLLAVDDVQWVDAPSLSWLAYLAPRAAELPVLVVVTAREGDPRARTPAVEMVLGDAAHRLCLSALGPASAGTLVRRELGRNASLEFCAACWELTGGNPLFVRELLAAARNERLTGGAESVGALRVLASSALSPSVRMRLARMGSDAIELAGAVAVLGSQHEVAIAAELAGLDAADAELVADELAAVQILAPGRPLDFSHPLIGEAVYAGMATGARRLAHRRAASILDRTGAADAVAAHLLMTGPAGDEWVVQKLSAAALGARERGAPEVAASYLRRALDEPAADRERPELLLRLGEAEWYTGRPTAVARLQAAVSEARDVTTLASAAGALANAHVLSDRTDQAVHVLQHAIDTIAGADPQLGLRLVGACALAGMVDDRTAAGANATLEQLRPSLDGDAGAPVRLLVASAEAAMRRAEAGKAAEQMIERALARQPDLPLNECTSIIVTLIGVESFGTLRRLCEDMMVAARRRSALQEMIGIASFSAWALCRMGELADAEAQARWALERATGIYAVDSLAHLVEILVERDAMDAAEVELARLEPPVTSHSIMAVTYLMARGQLRAAQGRAAEALADFLACGQRCDLLGIALAVYPWRSGAALAHAALGNAGEARRLASEEVAICRAFGRARALGAALRSAGMAELLLGHEDGGLAILEEAVTVLQDSQAPVELARGLTDYGAALRRAGRRDEARGPLERGLDLAHHWGARRIAGQARSELIAVGAKPRRDAITGRDALTAGELRVARLAAAGRSNREIAQALFITTKTASAHLSRVYRKLDITRREQLADALAGTRLNPTGPGGLQAG